MARLGQDDVLGAVGAARVRVDEVEVGVWRDAVERRVVAAPLDLVPADVGQRRRVLEAPRPARQHAERHGAVLVAALEQQLEPEADAEERPIGGDPAPDRLDETGGVEPLHRRRGRPDAGHDDRVGVFEILWDGWHGSGGRPARPRACSMLTRLPAS